METVFEIVIPGSEHTTTEKPASTTLTPTRSRSCRPTSGSQTPEETLP